MHSDDSRTPLKTPRILRTLGTARCAAGSHLGAVAELLVEELLPAQVMHVAGVQRREVAGDEGAEGRAFGQAEVIAETTVGDRGDAGRAVSREINRHTIRFAVVKGAKDSFAGGHGDHFVATGHNRLRCRVKAANPAGLVLARNPREIYVARLVRP